MLVCIYQVIALICLVAYCAAVPEGPWQDAALRGGAMVWAVGTGIMEAILRRRTTAPAGGGGGEDER